MSSDHDEQATLLRGIWTELKVVHQSLGRRLDETSARLERLVIQNSDRLVTVESRLDGVEARLDGVEVRLDGVVGELGALGGAMQELSSQQLELIRFVRGAMTQNGATLRDLRARDDAQDEAIAELDERVTRLEPALPDIPFP